MYRCNPVVGCLILNKKPAELRGRGGGKKVPLKV